MTVACLVKVDLIDDKSALIQVMAWCHQAPSHYLSPCWPSLLSPYDVVRQQWVKHQFSISYWEFSHMRWKMAAMNDSVWHFPLSMSYNLRKCMYNYWTQRNIHDKWMYISVDLLTGSKWQNQTTIYLPIADASIFKACHYIPEMKDLG